MLSNLNRRLAKVEQQVAFRARLEKLANCNCRPQDPEDPDSLLLVTNTKAFEAEMNLPCPVHGFRRLGQLFVLQYLESDWTISEESVRLKEVVEEYKRRLSEFLEFHPELEEDDSREF